MAQIIGERMTAVRDDGVVVFLIGMRVHRWWKVHKWLPVALAMGRMLRELYTNKASGLLGVLGSGMTMLQYWESTEKLLSYASDRNGQHFPAWADFYKRVGKNGDVGIWHETYVVPNGAFESIYVNMPPHGMGKFARLEPARGHRARAATRLQRSVATDHGAEPERHTADSRHAAE